MWFLARTQGTQKPLLFKSVNNYNMDWKATILRLQKIRLIYLLLYAWVGGKKNEQK